MMVIIIILIITTTTTTTTTTMITTVTTKIGVARSRLRKCSGSHGGEYEDDLSSGLLRRVVWQKFTDVSEVLAASIIRTITLTSANTIVYLRVFYKQVIYGLTR
jgi:hypothetical protein